MDVRLQSKLLRAIQERVIDRVGGTRPVPVDIRIIATSNRNLADAVREGTFREDLLFRLNVVNLKIPPLRERPADILELAQHFAKKYADANGVPLRPISAEARRVLTSNRWQGNVRELENTIHRSVLMAQGDEIGVDAILTPDGDRLDTPKTVPAVAHATFAAEQVTRALVGRTVADVERDLILETLKHCLGNRTHAANILGISIRTLRNKLNEYADGGLPITPAGAGDCIAPRRRCDRVARRCRGCSHRRENAASPEQKRSRIIRRVGLAEDVDRIARLRLAPGKGRIGIEREIERSRARRPRKTPRLRCVSSGHDASSSRPGRHGAATATRTRRRRLEAVCVPSHDLPWLRCCRTDASF